MMKNPKFIYVYFLVGVLFLILAGVYHSIEESNLTPIFTSIGFAIISISFVLLSLQKRCKNNKDDPQ
jgi:hypothetical membrane protein